MYILCSDLEGVFVPEIWINVALATGIEELKLTTRDINNYDVLMKGRLDILRQNKLTIHDIQKVIKGIDPLPGAVDFISWIKKRTGLIIVSDTFIEFADPLMEKLGRPTLLCNSLTIDQDGNITNYNLRQSDGKRKVTEALHNLNYKVVAVGDSYNDISMLRNSDAGILFRPPENVIKDNSDLPVTRTYEELKEIISSKEHLLQ
ncbi:MAG: bifunctional phosphoserine phosphatase/homoserine phosphotransferase ThrH [Bacteroidetes bacterium]|jgi:phosphoserine/homoserine phosphotransferase|nr:bifunctional phosphoserine phosphatase/homoserine phosphotransferase ThrH [Bacteroidota bacterium]